MANMAGKVRAEYDVQAETLLRQSGSAETGADTDWETAVALNKLTEAYWDNGEVADGLIKVNIHVAAGAVVAGNSNAYAFAVQACEDASGTGAVTVASLPAWTPTAAQAAEGAYFEMYVSSKLIEYLVPTGDFLRVGVTKTTSGGSPSVDYTSWMTFHGHP